MKTLDQNDIDLLLSKPLFRTLRAEDRARLLVHAKRRMLEAGEVLYDPQTPGTHVYLLQSGALRVEKNHTTALVESGFAGEELVLGGRAYASTAVAALPTAVFVLPVHALSELVATNPRIKSLLFDSYAGAATTETDAAAETRQPARVSQLSVTRVEEERYGAQLIGWICAIVLPYLVYKMGMSGGLGKDAAYFLAIITSAVTMWVFTLVPAFIPPLFSILATILFDIAPPEVAVAGFASSGFFMLMSIFAIGALMVMSGLTYRISLQILKIIPASPFWYNVSLLLYGMILTPVIPSQLGRTTIVLPFLSTLIGTAGGKRNDPAVAQLIVSAMAGVSLLASVFLTGKPANLIIFGLFDMQTQFAFAWLQWLIAASFTGIVLIALYFLIVTIFFKSKEHFGIHKHIIQSQVQTLGPMTGLEISALIAIGLVITGILTATYHKVDIAWMSMAIMVVLLLMGSLKRDDIGGRVDWTVIIFIASIVTWVPVMKLTGLDKLVFSYFSWIGVYMKTQLPLFILGLSLFIVLLRLALPEIVAEILLVTLLLPLANQAGVSPWLIGFIVLTMCETYIFPYQAPYHLQLKNHLANLGQDALYEERTVIRYNVLLTIARIAAIYASLPFWKYLDIL